MKTSHSKASKVRLFAVAALLIAVATIGMGANVASAAAPSVPFKTSISGTVAFTTATTFSLSGTALGTQVGLSSYAANGVFTSESTDVLTETITAANGDTLTIQCNQVMVQISPGVFHGTDTWTAIGGTGRFSGATGSGTGDSHVDLNVNKFTKQVNGTISVP